jgi:hypothetical protein
VSAIIAIDGTEVEVRNRAKFRVGDAIFSVKRVKFSERVAAREGGTTPVVVCVFEGGIPPENMIGMNIGQESPFPGDVVAELLKQGK